MSGGLRHPDWYLISEQRFRRRAIVTAGHQTFRGQAYLVLSDRLTGQHLRLTQRAEALWKMFDGEHTVQDLWAKHMTRTGNLPTQGEIVDWIMQLVSSGFLLSDHDLDPKHLSERGTRKRDKMLMARAASPLSIKLRLFDPNKLIRAADPFLGWLFTGAGGLAVLIVLVSALVTAIINREALFNSIDDTLLSQSGLVSLAIAYPVMKAFHELAHGLAVHRFGGQVREFGVMFLVFFPVPYVEASDANAFPDKRARMLVGAAGILAELLMSSIALFVWLQIEPGLERAILFNVMVIGSVSTVLFNGNPLLKFDSYFVLADWLEMPNLATRSGAYLSDRFLARTLGLRREVVPAEGEAWILGTYGVLSLAYRMVLTVTITLIVSQLFFVLGAILALWALGMGIVWPLVKLYRKGEKLAKSQNRTSRFRRRLFGLLIAIGGFGGFVDLPFSAPGEGQVTTVQEAVLRMGSSGLVGRFSIAGGAVINAGDPIPDLAERATIRARRGFAP